MPCCWFDRIKLYATITVDVDNDGEILTFDAAMIARHAIGLNNLENNIGCWMFYPDNRIYQQLSENLTEQNYDAIVVGDVDGSWNTGSELAKDESNVFNKNLLNNTYYINNDTLYLPFSNIESNRLLSFDLELLYSQNVYEFVGINKSACINEFNFFINQNDGSLRIAAYGINPIQKTDNLFALKLLIKEENEFLKTIELKKYQINNGRIVTSILNLNNSINNMLAPKSFKIYHNYPNPFNNSTVIQYYIPKQENVNVKIYNQNGALVSELLNENLHSGLHKIIWNGKNKHGVDVASGIYFVNIKYENISRFLKIMLIR